MFKSLILFGGILLMCEMTFIHGQEFRRDYVKINKGGWLKYHKIPQKWNDAVLTCFYEGAVLASPLNEDIKNALLSEMEHSFFTPIFVGIHIKYSKFVYQSMEGVSLEDMSVKWSFDRSSGNAMDNCIVMNSEGTVTEMSCQKKQPFACYKSEPVGEMNECGTVDNEYVFSNITGSCYKYHYDKQYWSDAYRICAAEGGYLAVINSQEEAEVIKKLLSKHVMKIEKSISIGFRDWSGHSNWMTIHGQSLHAAGYSKWYGNEPNNSTEYCGGIFRILDPENDSILNDVSCDSETYTFICEMT